jgi:hypothetical protein
MTNTRTITIKAATMIAAGSILVLINVSTAHGQSALENRHDAVVTAVSYTSESLRDPFQSYIVKETAPVVIGQIPEEEALPLPELTVTGITWGSSYAQAIVNGKIVKAGDIISGVQIVSISKDGLVVSFNNQQVTLPAPKAGSVKK